MKKGESRGYSMSCFFEENWKGRNPRVQNVTLKLWWVQKHIKPLKKTPGCVAQSERGGIKTREGTTSGVWRLERMKHGSGMKDREDKSSGIEILIAEAFAKIRPTEPLRLVKQGIGNSVVRTDVSRWTFKNRSRLKPSLMYHQVQEYHLTSLCGWVVQ